MKYRNVGIVVLSILLLMAEPRAFGQDTSVRVHQAALILEQRDFISKFSGATPYDETDALSARSTRVERSIAANIIEKELLRRGLNSERHRYKYPNIHFILDLFVPPMQGRNIVSHIPATKNSEVYVVLGAHFDSVKGSPGANDNATGVAAALSIASILTELETRNVHFLIVFFDQEEDDSPGSKAFARRVINDGLQIHSMHNIDMIGWDGDRDRTVELDVLTKELELIYFAAAKRQDIEVTKVLYNSSDHQSFRDFGVDAVCLSEEVISGDRTPHYHKPSDKIEAVDFELLASITLLMSDVMIELATSE